MAELGVPDPGSWASSEITEDIAQQARYLALRRIWAIAMAPWRDQHALCRYSSLTRLLDHGTDPDLLATAIRQVVLETVVSVISVIDDGFDPTAPGDAPGWALMETRDDGSAGTLTGRNVGGLHEACSKPTPSTPRPPTSSEADRYRALGFRRPISRLNRCSACARWHMPTGLAGIPIRRSARPCSGWRVAQRDDLWSRRSREIRLIWPLRQWQCRRPTAAHNRIICAMGISLPDPDRVTCTGAYCLASLPNVRQSQPGSIGPCRSAAFALLHGREAVDRSSVMG
jgi:hypothetical protein